MREIPFGGVKDEDIESTFPFFEPFEVGYGGDTIIGTYQVVEQRICVSHAMCDNGYFSALMKYLCDKYETDRVLIYNILNEEAWAGLRGFRMKLIPDPMMDDIAICMEGRWER